MAATAGAGFDDAARTVRAQAVGERLHQPPGVEARQELGLAPPNAPPSRWSLRTIRAAVDTLADYSRSGVWRLLRRLHLQRRPLRDPRYSPDPEYLPTVAHLERCLREAVRWPKEEVVVLFLDERGYSRWPEVAPDWQMLAPVAARQGHKAGPTNRQQRLVGALNAYTGQVDSLDNYLVGREQVRTFYRRLDHVSPRARRL